MKKDRLCAIAVVKGKEIVKILLKIVAGNQQHPFFNIDANTSFLACFQCFLIN